MNDSSDNLAGLYVLDQLDDRERAAFEARLLREPELAVTVRELEAGLARGIRTLPPVAPTTDLLGRIEERIDRSTLVPLTANPFPRRPWTMWAGWGIAAVIAVSLATLAIQSVRHAGAQPVFVVVGLDANRNTFAELPQTAATKDLDARFIQLASLANNYWSNPAALPVQTQSATGTNRGYALFDPASQQGFIAIEQLPALTENQRYHLWVADASTGRVRDAGTLPLAGLNRGLYSFTLDAVAGDAAKSSRPQLFVTAEDAGTPAPPDQPRGKVVLGQRTF
jgi:anti-sigma-K factor RskA